MEIRVFGDRATELRQRYGLDEGVESVEVLLTLRVVEGHDVVTITI